MYPLLLILEVLLTAVVILPLALFAPLPMALAVIVILLAALIFLRPARRLYVRYRAGRRTVVRPVPKEKRPAYSDDYTMRPQDHLTPAEVFRLMEIIGAIPRDRLPCADFTATLLDLNRRGILPLSLQGVAGEEIRILLPDKDTEKKLASHEQELIKLLRQAAGTTDAVRLAALHDFVLHAHRRAQKRTDAFRRSVDAQLLEKKMLGYLHPKVQAQPKNPDGSRKKLLFKGKRLLALTMRGEQSAALWNAYRRNIVSYPYFASYRPKSPELQRQFEDEALLLLTDAAGCGVCARAASALMREYLFDPQATWRSDLFFSTLTEARTAFSEDDGGEKYFFLPLREFEDAIAECTNF